MFLVATYRPVGAYGLALHLAGVHGGHHHSAALPPHSLSWWILVFLAALATGALVGVCSSGGAAILTPLLATAFGVPVKVAVGSDLFANLAMRAAGAGIKRVQREFDKRLVLAIAAGAVPGAVAGSLASADLKKVVSVKVVYGVVLAVVLLSMATVAMRISRSGTELVSSLITRRLSVRVRTAGVFVASLLGGAAIGLTSIGAGTLIGSATILLLPELELPVVVGSDLIATFPAILAAALVHLAAHDVSASLAAVASAGGVIGVATGTLVASLRFAKIARIAVLVALAVLAGRLAFLL